MHADTAGTKTALAYLYWKQKHRGLEGIAQDALVMNLDDMACVGVPISFSFPPPLPETKRDTGKSHRSWRSKAPISLYRKRLAEQGIHIHHSGGETADVGDIVRTIDVGITAFARIPKSSLLVNRIRPRRCDRRTGLFPG